jgi:hypothetical protein
MAQESGVSTDAALGVVLDLREQVDAPFGSSWEGGIINVK